MKLYGVCYICYFSSHDDFVALFSTKEKSEAAVEDLNNKEKQRLADLDKIPVENYKFPYNTAPYYVYEFDVSEYYDGNDLPNKWKIAYRIPSVGKFWIGPDDISMQSYELDPKEIPDD